VSVCHGTSPHMRYAHGAALMSLAGPATGGG
jgi:hypothetical protein